MEDFNNNEELDKFLNDKLAQNNNLDEMLDYVDEILDYENSYDKYEKQEEMSRKFFESNRNKNDDEITHISITNNDGSEKKIVLNDNQITEKIEEPSFFISSDEEKNLNLSEKDLQEETKISIIDNDGNEKQFIISNPNEIIHNPFQNELEKNQGKEKVEDQLQELKEYISKNKDSIKNIEVKKGSYNKKISLKDFINKELNQVNYNSNPDKLAEDLIISLLKPIKIYSNYINQNQSEKILDNKKNNLAEDKNYTIKLNNKEYSFIGYSENYDNIIVANKEGKQYEYKNNQNLNFINGPEKKFSEMEMNLINKGKSLIVKENIPFKINLENNKIEFKTITKEDYTKNINVNLNNKKQQVNKITN